MTARSARKTTRPLSKEGFSRWDAKDHLKTRAQIAAYLEACMEEGADEPAFLAAALGDIARARGMASEELYQSLAADGNPSFSTVLTVIRAVGLKLTIEVN